MRNETKALFCLLILAQAAHSLEEYATSLWTVLAPARWVSETLGGDDLARGFAIANVTIVVVGVLCCLGPVLRSWPSARGIAWFWVALEGANGIGHTLLALGRGAYFPGLYTAPVLMVLAAALAVSLIRSRPELGGDAPLLQR